MNEDPFAGFERSRGGLLIPVLLFVAGAIPTVLAARMMDELVVLEQVEELPENQNAAVDPAAQETVAEQKAAEVKSGDEEAVSRNQSAPLPESGSAAEHE